MHALKTKDLPEVLPSAQLYYVCTKHLALHSLQHRRTTRQDDPSQSSPQVPCNILAAIASHVTNSFCKGSKTQQCAMYLI